MNTWWNKKWGKDNLCALTQSRLRPGKNKIGISHCIKIECGHMFYTKPLIVWLENNSTCPVCRFQISHLKF
jgi:hypothetical protein